MYEQIKTHPTPEVSFRDNAKLIKFTESPMGHDENTVISINPRYKITSDDLHSLMYLPAAGEAAVEKPLPRINLSRGREAGTSAEPVLIKKKLADGRTYQVVGIVAVKGFGLRELESTDPQSYRGPSLGVLGVTEATIDSNMGDMLSEEGASVGDYLGIISVPKETFLKHFKDDKIGGEQGKKYAQHLETSWNASEEYQNRYFIDGIARLTDPERLDYRTFCNPVLLLSSALWLQAEYRANGADFFQDYYQLPPGYADHLNENFRLNAEEIKNLDQNEKLLQIVKSQAKLLAFIITRNYALALKNNVDTSFSNKDIGNLGKLHDFPISLDRLIPGDDGKNGFNEVVNPELPMTRGSFCDLVIDVFFNSDSGLHTYLSEEDFREIANYLDHLLQVDTQWSIILAKKAKKAEDKGKSLFTFQM